MPLAIFEPLGAPNRWKPSALAAGPFAGLQGGAVASLLTAEVEALAGVRGLRAALAARRPQFYRTLTRKLLTFALGRGLEPSDECTVDQLVADLTAQGGHLSTLIVGIARSRPFQLRRGTP